VTTTSPAPEDRIATAGRESRPLDEWYRVLNRIYLEPNFRQDAFTIFAHLVEVVGGLSLLASDKPHKPELQVERYLPKALSWWFALCGRVGVASVETLLWTKFPWVCPYCRLCPHDHDRCSEMKATSELDWVALETLGGQNAPRRPRSITDWQRMFRAIYPQSSVGRREITFARMTEELGELAEAVRVFTVEPSYFISEAADLFAWLMQFHNSIDRSVNNLSSGRLFADEFPDLCRSCGQSACICPPIRPETLGRIAHEVPLRTATFLPGGNLLSPHEVRQHFEIAQELRLGSRVVAVGATDRAQLLAALGALKTFLAGEADRSPQLMNQLARIAEQQRLTSQALTELRTLMAAESPERRATAYEILLGVAGNAASDALMAMATYVMRGG
jgi:hypothetical protein